MKQYDAVKASPKPSYQDENLQDSGYSTRFQEI
jgi:hypothetical protein